MGGNALNQGVMASVSTCTRRQFTPCGHALHDYTGQRLGPNDHLVPAPEPALFQVSPAVNRASPGLVDFDKRVIRNNVTGF